MRIIPAVDTAGVTLAAYVEDGLHHVKCCLELALILEQGKECGQLLGGEEVILADAFHSAAGNHKELRVVRNFKASCLSELLRADSNGIRKSVAGLVPHNLLNHLSLLIVQQITALILKSSNNTVINLFADNQVSVAGASGTEVRALGDSGVHSRLSSSLGSVCCVVDDNGSITCA